MMTALLPPAALVEGEATLVMSEYTLKNLSLATLKDSLASTFSQDMAQLAEAPAYLRETLIFPYLRGQEFCGALYGRGEYDAVSKAYTRPTELDITDSSSGKVFRGAA
jgi:hypothetical protein